MFKKIIFPMIISIIIAICISCRDSPKEIFISYKDSSKEIYITSLFPVYLKADADFKSKTIEELNNSTKVIIESEKDITTYADGQYEKWYYIKTKKNKGWIFGGYLRNYKIDELIPTAIQFHKKLYRKHYPNDRSLQKIDPKSYKFKQIVHDYVILTHGCPSFQGAGFEGTGDSLWYMDKQTKKWVNVDIYELLKSKNIQYAMFSTFFLNQFEPNSTPKLIEIDHPYDMTFKLYVYSLENVNFKKIQSENISNFVNSKDDITVDIAENKSLIKAKEIEKEIIFNYNNASKKFELQNN